MSIYINTEYWSEHSFKNFAIFTGKHLCWSLFLIKLQDIVEFLITPTLKNICKGLLLFLLEPSRVTVSKVLSSDYF